MELLVWLSVAFLCGIHDAAATKTDNTGNICLLKPDTGPCLTLFYKWYYNSVSKKCEQFIYGGCLGNANRFDTKLECQLKCADACTLPNHYGDIFCLAFIPRWWFNPKTQQCEQFIYGGCFGTRNNFLTEEACFDECDKSGCPYVNCLRSPCAFGYKMKDGCRDKDCLCICPCYKYKRCKEHESCKKKLVKKRCKGKKTCVAKTAACRNPPCRITGTCRTTAPVPACQQKPHSGCGKQKLIRWYNNRYSLEGCSWFYYTGEDGNLNRFNSRNECLDKCR